MLTFLYAIHITVSTALLTYLIVTCQCRRSSSLTHSLYSTSVRTAINSQSIKPRYGASSQSIIYEAYIYMTTI